METPEEAKLRDEQFKAVQDWINKSFGFEFLKGKRLPMGDLRKIELIPGTPIEQKSPTKFVKFINIGKELE